MVHFSVKSTEKRSPLPNKHFATWPPSPPPPALNLHFGLFLQDHKNHLLSTEQALWIPLPVKTMPQTQLRPQTAEANHGSRTMTINQTSTSHEDGNSASNPGADSSSSSSTPLDDKSVSSQVGVLRLRGRALNHTKVQWDGNVVDNEFLNRKKSKICCIYHKPKEFDESSDEDSDSSCGSADSRQGSRRIGHHHDHPTSHDHALEPSGEQTEAIVHSAPSPPPPNAYERPPGGGKGKSRA